MRYLKGQIDNPDFTPIITDGKVYILRYNFEEENDKNYVSKYNIRRTRYDKTN